jgi:hypothetical protein
VPLGSNRKASAPSARQAAQAVRSAKIQNSEQIAKGFENLQDAVDSINRQLKKTSASSESSAGQTPPSQPNTAPSNVSITSVSAEPTTSDATRYDIEIHYIAPTGTNETFKGVYVQIEAPDQSSAPSITLGVQALGAGSLSGPAKPYSFGPFSHDIAQGVVKVTIPAPSPLPMTCRARLISYSDEIVNDAATSPSMSFVVFPAGTFKPASGTAYCANPILVIINSVSTLKPSGR